MKLYKDIYRSVLKHLLKDTKTLSHFILCSKEILEVSKKEKPPNYTGCQNYYSYCKYYYNGNDFIKTKLFRIFKLIIQQTSLFLNNNTIFNLQFNPFIENDNLLTRNDLLDLFLKRDYIKTNNKELYNLLITNTCIDEHLKATLGYNKKDFKTIVYLAEKFDFEEGMVIDIINNAIEEPFFKKELNEIEHNLQYKNQIINQIKEKYQEFNKIEPLQILFCIAEFVCIEYSNFYIYCYFKNENENYYLSKDV